MLIFNLLFWVFIIVALAATNFGWGGLAVAFLALIGAYWCLAELGSLA
ncbi:hypothetical protein GS534_00975 [Rhodococcus hoagii]|nr:hypothetical protein [Prescottella equi]